MRLPFLPPWATKPFKKWSSKFFCLGVSPLKGGKTEIRGVSSGKNISIISFAFPELL